MGQPTGRGPYLWMLAGCVAFACMGSFAHALRDTCDWQLIALVRSSLALIFAVLLAVAAGARLVLFRPRILWVRSLAGSVSLVCTFFALTRLPQSDVLTLTNTFPLWVALLSWPLYGQTPSVGLWLALAAGLAGVALVQQPHFASGNRGALSALVASFATAVAMLGLNRIRDVDTRAVVAHFSGVSALACAACFILLPRRPEGLSLIHGASLLKLLGVGVSATAGQLCLTRAFSTGPPTRVALVGLTQVPFAMLLDAVVFGYQFSGWTLLGVALVLLPTAWVMTRR